MTVNQFEIQVTPPERTNVAWLNPADMTINFYVDGQWKPIGGGSVTIQPFPESWPTTGTMSQLISAINSDEKAVVGTQYLSTVKISDLPASLVQAEVKAEITDSIDGLGKVIVFTITSDSVSPYRWEYTSSYGQSGSWRAFECEDNKVTSLSALSTDVQYPSAKCVYDIIGNVESLLAQI